MYNDFRDQNGNAVSTETVLTAIKQPILRHEAGFILYYPDGVTPKYYVREDDYIRESLIITNSCGSDGIKLGSVNIGMLKIVLKNEKVATFQSPDDLIDCRIDINMDIDIQNDTKVDVRGHCYYVKEVEQLTEGVKLTCYDGMCKLDTAFSGALTGTPYQILTQAATACGVRVQSTQAEIEAIPNGTRTFTLHEDNDCKTWRDVLSYLSALMGCFVTFGRRVYGSYDLPGIEVRTFGGGAASACDTVTDYHRYSGSKFSLWDTAYAEFTLKAYALEDPNDPDSVTKKDFTYNDATVSDYGQTYDLGYNPFLQAATPEADLTSDQTAILHDLLAKMATYQYTPMQISLPVGFIYDLGDVIKCSGGYANTGFAGGATDDAYGVILNETYTYGREYRIKSLDSHAQSARKIVSDSHLYGVEWDGSATYVLTRTDDSANFNNPEAYMAGSTTYGSPFDNLMPWSGIERVSNSEAGELVKIPKFWFKLDTSNGFKLQISDRQKTGFSVAPAFMDRGDGKGERDFAYVGRYHCSSIDYKSTSGGTPKVEISRPTARAAISALGNDVWQWDYAMVVTIQMLYLVEFANWDCGAMIGVGDARYTSGDTDSMPYHTGTTGAARNYRSYGVIQYRYIEDFGGSYFDWCDGIRYTGMTNVHIIKNPAEFSDAANGVLVGQRFYGCSGYIVSYAQSNVSGFEWFYYPSAAEADPDHIPSQYSNYGNEPTPGKEDVLRVGGGNGGDPPSWYASDGTHNEFFSLSDDVRCSGVLSEWSNVSSRLMYLP